MMPGIIAVNRRVFVVVASPIHYVPLHLQVSRGDVGEFLFVENVMQKILNLVGGQFPLHCPADSKRIAHRGRAVAEDFEHRLGILRRIIRRFDPA